MKQITQLYVLLLFVATFSLTAQAQITQTAVCNGGNLSTVAAGYLTTVTNLKITGTIDARDFKTMRDAMPLLTNIDLSATTITEYTGTEGTDATSAITYMANAIPNFAFSTSSNIGKTSLKNFAFPASLTAIGTFAFYNCTGLTSISTSSTTPINLSSSPNAFNGIDKSKCHLLVPAGTKALYAATMVWKDFSTIIDTPPTAPVLYNPTTVSDTTLTANWNNVTDASSFILDVATDISFTNKVKGYDNLEIPNATEYQINGLSTTTTYYYRLRAKNPAGISDYSNVISLSTVKSNQVIIFNPITNRQLGNAPFTVSAIGGTSGNPIVFTSSDNTIATCTGVNGATITLVGGGTCTINANQSGNNIYYEAAQASQSLTVTTQTIYVKPSTTSSAWQSKSNVYPSLQEALPHATTGVEIWIAAGTYYPTADTIRTTSFILKEGVTLLGGFTGNETKKEQRNWIANKTILSGNIRNQALSTDNSYQVININSTSTGDLIIIDGLTICDGRGDNKFNGGAIISGGGNVRVLNCCFENNTGFNGGALASPNNSTNFNFANCIFTNNSSVSNGAVFYQLNTSSNFYNCIFTKNESTAGGIISSRGNIYNSILWNNKVDGNALSAYYESYQLTYHNCIIENGPSTNGCLIGDPKFLDTSYQISTTSPCIENGSATVLPNWMDADYKGLPRIAGTRVDIGLYETESRTAPTLTSPIDRKLISPAPIELKWSYFSSLETLTGFKIEIAIDNKAPQTIETGKANSYLLNIDALAHVYSWRIMAIHTNSTSAWSQQYIFNVDRERIIYVRQNAKGDGTTWKNAFGKLESALASANVGDEIWVASGTYISGQTSMPKSYVLKQGVKLYGGFLGNETNRLARNWSKNSTILSGEGTESSVLIGKGDTKLENYTILDGFTITKGYVGYETAERSGAGLLLIDYKLIIANCLITDNNAYLLGGGIYAANTQLEIYNSIVSQNRAASNGAGIYVNGGKVKLFNSLVYKNDAYASEHGGIEAVAENQCEIYNTIVCENKDWNKKVSNTSSNILSNSSFIGDSTALITEDGLNISNKSPYINKGDAAYVTPKYLTEDYYGNQRIRGAGVEMGPFEMGAETPTPMLPANKTVIKNPTNSNITLKWSYNDTPSSQFDIQFWPSEGDTTLIANISTKTISLQFPNGTSNWRIRYAGETADSCWSQTYKFTNFIKPRTIYVNALLNGNGTSWEQPFASLKDAILDAKYGDEIWIAQGTYSTSAINDTKENFEITNGISLYGGFKGDEIDKSKRNISLYKTILSGELGDVNSDTDNSQNILTIQGDSNADGELPTIINGLYIEKNRNSNNYYGALLIKNCNPIIENCVFRYNTAKGYNSVISCNLSSPKIENCLFHNNSSTGLSTVIYISGDKERSTSITNCTFINNYNSSDDPIVSNRWSPNSTIELRNCIFWGNFHNPNFTTDNEIEGCIVTNCSFERRAHSATSIFGDPKFNDAANGDFSLNSNSPCINAGDNMACKDTTDLALKQRIVGGIVDMGAIESSVPKVQLEEPIKSAPLQMSSTTIPALRWNDADYVSTNTYMTQYWVKGTADTIKTTVRVEQTTPLLTLEKHKEYEWRVGVFSTALNEYAWSNVETFVTGRGEPIYVKEGESGTGDSWSNALGKLTSALDIATTGDQIWVAKGTYYPSESTDRESFFNIASNISLFGGFSGFETKASARNSAVNKTILSGNIGNKLDSTDNAKRILKISNTDIAQLITIDGFTISDCYNMEQEYGAVSIYKCSPLITNCIITKNHSKANAGILIESGNPIISNSLLAYNVSDEFGCAIKSDELSNPTIINCTIARNESKGNSAIKGSATVFNSIIYNNINKLGYISVDKALVNNSCVETTVNGENNVFIDPNFKEQQYFTLNSFSPCLNAGNNHVAAPYASDLFMNKRLINEQVDLGASEIQTLPTLQITSIVPENKSSLVDKNPVIEITFNADVKLTDGTKLFIEDQLVPLEQLPSNKTNTLRFKADGLGFYKEYKLIVNNSSYQSQANERITGNDTTTTFTTRLCQKGAVSLTVANNGNCIDSTLTIDAVLVGDVALAPTWYINNQNQNRKTNYFDIAKIGVNNSVKYTNTDQCGTLFEASLNLNDHIEPIEVLKKWDDVLFVNNGDQRFLEYSWYMDNVEVSKKQYLQIESKKAGYVFVSALDINSRCVFVSDSINFQIDASNDIQLFPNPAKALESITIKSKETMNVISIRLLDIYGYILTTQSYTDESATFDFQITDVIPGAYFLVIKTNENTVTKKVLITK